MKLSVIIVSYNVKYYLEQCLNSIQRAIEGIEAEVFVVDNHSRDGSVSFLQKRFSWVHYVASNHNLGFARANNIAIQQSKGEYVLLLNPDTIVGENVIHESLDFMDTHREAGAVGVQMLKTDGTSAMESRRGLPTPMVSFYKIVGLCSRFPDSRRFGRYYMSYLPWNQPAQIEVISGAYCLLRRQALERVGLLDEDFFMYGEDIDLSYRVLKGGFENWYLPCKILHYKGESTQKSSFRYVHVFYDAMLIFFRKHYGHLSCWLSIPIKAAIYMKASLALVQMMSARVRKSLGFFPSTRKWEPEYVFIGQQTAIDQCRKIARNKGLSAQFFVADAATCPDGHLSLMPDVSAMIPHRSSLVLVYDTDAYSYEQILELFSRKPIENVHIGTYNRKSRTILTLEETVR